MRGLRWFGLLGLIVALGLILPVGALAQEEDQKPPVRALFFFSSEDEGCIQTIHNAIQPVVGKIGTQVQIRMIDLEKDPQGEVWLKAVEEAYGVSAQESTLPALFIGEEALLGQEEIEAHFEEVVTRYQADGVDYPDVPRPGGEEKPVVKFLFFFSETCPHCQYVEKNVFPVIQEKYGEQVEWYLLNVSERASFELLYQLGMAVGVPENSRGAVPAIFMGEWFPVFLLGDSQIEELLPKFIDWYLARGGVDYPSWFYAFLAETAATSTPEATATPEVAPVIHVAYFAQEGCGECDRVQLMLEALQGDYPSLEISTFDVQKDAALNEWLGEKVGMPEELRLDAPAIFIGQDYLVGDAITLDAVEGLIQRYAQTGAPALWEEFSPKEAKAGEENILARFRSYTAPAVFGYGLIDGVNPCAFATLIFLVSYLALTGRKGKEILAVGASFTLAIFLAYLAVGLGLLEFIRAIGTTLARWLNLLVGLLCIVLAVLSLVDFFKTRGGQTEEMILKVPHRLRRVINRVIRQGARSEAYVTAAFVSGAVVSLIEFVCTGQVYVPIITALSHPDLRGQAFFYLVLYCIAFVVPLIAVFVAVYWGTSSKRLSELLRRYTSPVKLIMSIMFLLLGVWLIYEVLPFFGLIGG